MAAEHVRLLAENVPHWGDPAAVPGRQGLNLGTDYSARVVMLPPPVLQQPQPDPCTFPRAGIRVFALVEQLW